jgi:hypothetical protein
MKTNSRHLLFLFVLPLVFPTMAQTNYLTWSTNADNTLTITSYTGPVYAIYGGPAFPLTVPQTINGLTVTIIGNYAFMGYPPLGFGPAVSYITLPDTITSIGANAFGCPALTNIYLGTNLTTIGAMAFESCSSLSNVTIPPSVTSIGDFAFNGCGVVSTNLVFGTNLTNIGAANFQGCQTLTNLTILGNTTIGSNAFYQCRSLQSVYINGGVIGYGAFGSCNNEGEFFGGPITGLTTLTLGNGVTSIGDWAFADDLITNLVIPDSVTNIGDYSLSGENMTSIVIPGSVPSIGYGAFEDDALTNVTFSHGFQSIEGFAFYGTSLRDVTFPDSLTYIGSSAFYACGNLAGSMIIPASVKQMAGSAFAFAPATNMLFLGNAPTVIGDQGAPFLNQGSTTAIVYYLPGTTGWGPTYGGGVANQTALWNPTMQGAAVSNGQFGFNITGTSNIPVVVEACTNLASPVWVPLQSFVLTNGSVYFSDTNSASFPTRYYGIGFP